MKLVSNNIPLANYAQPQSVTTIALETTFTGGLDEGGMFCTARFEVRLLGTDPNVEMPLVSGGTMDMTPYLPPQLAAGLEAWFDAIAPQLLKRLAPKPVVTPPTEPETPPTEPETPPTEPDAP